MAWAVSILDCGTKYRPTSTFPAQTTLSLNCARGQWACFQIAVNSSAATQAGVNVTATAPTGWIDTTIFREVPYYCQVASRSDGAVGEWPDALVPKVDVFYDEARSAFPFTVSRVSAVYPYFDLAGTGENKISRANVVSRVKPVVTGTFSGASAITYRVKIEAGATTFKWTDDGTNASPTWDGTTVALNAGSAVSLNNGLSVTWSNADTYVADEEWVFVAAPTRTELVWVEAYIPENTTPGSYTFTAQVSATGQTAVDLTANVTVHQCQVPLTSTFKTLYYATNGRAALANAHTAGTTEDSTLCAKYQEAALRNRINLQNVVPPPAWNGSTITNWSTHYSWWQPFIEGTGNWAGKMNLLPLRQASTDQYIFGHLRNNVLMGVSGTTDPNWSTLEPFSWSSSVQGFLAKYYENLTAAGVGLTPYVETVEEPSFSTSDPPLSPPYTRAMQQMYTEIETNFPTLVAGVSKRYVSSWESLVPWWIVPLYTFSPYPRSLYNTAVANGAEVWSYLAYSSLTAQFGIAGTKWPLVEIDQDAPKLRSYYWLLFDNDVIGDLYSGVIVTYSFFLSTWASPRQMDPWDTSVYYATGGNGEGKYFYPGRAAQVSSTGCGSWFPDGIGGTHDIPIETIRLKYLRQGIEDWEIFKWTTANTDNPYYVKQQIQAAVGDKKCYWDVAPTAANMETARTNILFRKNPPIEEPPPVVQDPVTYKQGGSISGVVKGSYNATMNRLRVTATMWRDNRNG